MMKLLSFFFLILLQSEQLFAVNLQGANQKSPLAWTNVRLNPQTPQAGDRVHVLVDLQLLNGFYAYEDKVRLFPLVPDGLRIGDVKIKPLSEFVDFAGKKHTGIVGHSTLEFFVEIPNSFSGNLGELIFDIEYVACTQKICLPRNRLEVRYEINDSKSTSSSYIEKKIGEDLWSAFFFIFIIGFLTSLTPCVYPLIPITLAVIGARTAKSSQLQALLLSIVYVLGIATTYSLLGVVAAKTGALFGQALSYPIVILSFSALFMAMALSIYGYYEIQIPHFITRKLTRKKSKAGFFGAYLAGLIAGVIASPCVGPVLVGVLAYIAKSQDMFLGFSLLFTFALGMGVLFIAIGTFSSAFQKLPKSGPWMDGIKFILGTALLALSIYYMKPILPRSWFATVCALLLAAAVLSFLVKIYPKSNRKLLHWAPIVFCILAFLTPLFSQVQTDTSLQSNERAALAGGWQYYSEEKIEEAKSKRQPVIIDFFADWCAACIELDEKTFSTVKFKEAAKDFMLLKVDATETFPELVDLQKTYDIYGLPTIIFIGKDGGVLKSETLTGFEEIDLFLKRMQKANQ